MKGSLKVKLEPDAPWTIHTRGIGFLRVYLQVKAKLESDTPWTIHTRGTGFIGVYLHQLYITCFNGWTFGLHLHIPWEAIV